MKPAYNKIVVLFCVFTLGFANWGCKKLNIGKELRIDLGTYFSNDYVVIKLNNDVVFSGGVSTDLTIGVGEIITFDYPTRRYELTVSINGIETKEKFRHKKNRFIYITFDKVSSKITIIYPDQKYVYD